MLPFSSRSAVALLAVLMLGTASALAAIAPKLMPARDPQNPKKLHLLKVLFTDKTHPTGFDEPILRVTEAAGKRESYRLFSKRGNDLKPVVIAAVRFSAIENAHANEFLLRTAEELETGVVYTLIPNPGTWIFDVEGRVEAYVDKTPLPVDPARIEADKAYLTGREKKVQVQTGFAGGVLSLDWTTSDSSRAKPHPADAPRFDWELGVKADIVLPNQRRNNYADSIKTGGRVFWSDDWGDSESTWRFYVDIDAHANYESSQNFDTQDFLAGVDAHASIGNPLTDWLGTALLGGRHRTAVLSPLFTLGYDHASHIRRSSEDAPAGDERLKIALFWRMAVAREISLLKQLGLTQQSFDIDFITELEGIFDVELDRFTDNSKLTLEFRPHLLLADNVSLEDAAKLPSFTFTYARGRATPTFRNFDTLLAGFKFPF